MKTALLTLALLAAGCARPDKLNERVRLPMVTDETQILVACPDDGIHAIVDGKCVDTAEPLEPCPKDGRHERVNDICVDVLGK